jgi:hypothetical protein
MIHPGFIRRSLAIGATEEYDGSALLNRGPGDNDEEDESLADERYRFCIQAERRRVTARGFL